jgi:uncharacterized membrane protein YdjX (TVP38/TMEM64 family)
METGITKRQALLSLAGLVVVIGGLYLLLHYFGITQVQQAVESAGVWAPLVFVVAKASTLVIAPLGGSPLYPLGGVLFGFWDGVLYVMLGDLLGGTIAFWISRIFGRSVAERFLGDDRRFLGKALRMMGTPKGFLIARICFSGLQEIAAYGAGLTRLRFVPFIAIHAAVNLLPVMLLVWMGFELTGDNWWSIPIAYGVAVVAIGGGLVLFHAQVKRYEPALEEH